MADTLFTHGPANVLTLLATTLENRKKGIQDQIFDELATIKAIRERGSFTEKVDGGASNITEALMYGRTGTVNWFEGHDPIDTTPAEGFTNAQFKWKELAGSVSVTAREQLIQNSGKAQLIDLVDAKINQLTMELKEALNTAMYTASPTSKQPNSLATVVAATGEIGDINPSTYSWWASYVKTGGSFATQGLSDMNDVYTELLTRGSKPDLLITTPSIHQFYEANESPFRRYASLNSVDGGVKNLSYKGIEIVMDAAASSGVIYFLDSRHIKFYVSANADMRQTDWKEPHNQLSKVKQIHMACELGTNNRRRLGKVTTVTA